MVNEVIMKELISNMSDVELKVLKQKIDAILEGDLKALNVDIKNKDLFEEMKTYLECKALEGKTDATIKQYSSQITRLINFLEKPISYIRTEDIRKYLNYNKTTKYISDLTLENERVYISAFFKWLKQNGYISTNPCNLIAPIKFEKKEREPMTSNEMDRLRESCSTLRDKALIETLYSTGCRVSELTRIKLNDINFEKKEVHLFGKGKKHRTSFLNERAIEAINNYLKNRNGNSEYLIVSERFPFNNITVRTVEKRIKFLGEKANIQGGVYPHRIRHTVATDALSNGMPIEQVQMFLGHEDISTTQIYAKTLKDNLKKSHLLYVK